MTRIARIDLDENEDPTEVHVVMSTLEAALVAKLVGKLSATSAEEVIARGGAEAVRTLYEGLVGGYFNRFYDGGVDDYLGSR